MRSIRYKQIIAVFLLSIMVTSCAPKENSKQKTNTNRTENITDQTPIPVTPEPTVSSTIVPEPTETVISKETNKSEIKQTTKASVSQSVYTSNANATYDNTRYGWSFKKVSGSAPMIPKVAQSLSSKYSGIYAKNTDEKELYLTFDEGYENGYTSMILDTLKKHNVPAAFFITGPYLKKQQVLIKRMLNEGHIVGNHTINHPSMPDIKDNNKLEEEILGLERSYYEMFGKRMEYFRPPKGEYSERTMAITQSFGYKTVFWSFAYKDWEVNNQKGTEYAYNQIMGGIHNGAVLLLHAVSKDNAEVLDVLIKDLKEKGFIFKSLDEFN